MLELLVVVAILCIALKLILGIGPTFASLCRWLGRGAWRYGFKNQYDRRGCLWSCAHALSLIVALATFGAIMSPETPAWGFVLVALWWCLTATFWLLVKQWHQLKQRKRRLPKRH